MWVTARYLWHGKWQCRCVRGRENAAQKVETLLANKNKNGAVVFSIFIEYHTEVKIET